MWPPRTCVLWQVHDMLDRTWAELRLYERVVRNWPLFGPHLEAALCDVLRTVQGSLNRICQGANGNTVMQQGPPGEALPAHAAAPPLQHHGTLYTATPLGPQHQEASVSPVRRMQLFRPNCTSSSQGCERMTEQLPYPLLHVQVS